MLSAIFALTPFWISACPVMPRTAVPVKVVLPFGLVEAGTISASVRAQQELITVTAPDMWVNGEAYEAALMASRLHSAPPPRGP